MTLFQVFTLLALVAVVVCTNRSYLQQNVNAISLLSDARIDQFDHGIVRELKDCPTWMFVANVSAGECVCGVSDYHAVKCDQSVGKVYVLDGHQITYDVEHQEVVVGASLYGISDLNVQFDIYNEVPTNTSHLNEAMHVWSFQSRGQVMQ